MKKTPAYLIISSLIVLAFSSIESVAQSPTTLLMDEPNDGVIKKKTRFVGTFFNFGNTFNTESTVNGVKSGTSAVTYGGNITAGSMLSNHWAAIANVGISNVTTITYDYKTNAAGDVFDLNSQKINYTFTGSMRYYKLVSEGNYFFLQFSGQYLFGSDNRVSTNNTKGTQTNNNYNDIGGGISINPGFTAFISKHLAAEISIGVLGYSFLNGKDAYGNTSTTGGFQFLFYQNSVNLGFVYYFEKK
ncbi:MAG TPA: hypothetical protein VK750_09640 [Cytophagaceae bacterium]|jgi:hypothetical protein|nr:hypothetical protein [Cytophagaceae bacterium]